MISSLFLAQARLVRRTYYDETFLHPLGATAVVILGLLTFTLPRRLAVLPFLVLVCFIPSSQRVAIAGLDFSLLRILVICGGVRLLFKGEIRDVQWTTLDKLMLAWGVVEASAYVLLHRNFGAVVYMSGRMLESLGMYFVARGFIRSWRDLRNIAIALALLSIPSAAAFIREKTTARNLFSVFGGVSEVTAVRQGKLRAMGALGHPILAGCFWAAAAPLIASLWWAKRHVLAVVGVVCSFIVVIACASSTPLGGFMAGIAAASLFTIRTSMHQVRMAIVLMLVAAQIQMDQPIWHLLVSIDLVGGSTGWHRYILVDAWIRRFPEWALFGSRNTAAWGFGLDDVTCQYVLEGVRGGFAAFVLFMAQIVVSFKYVGVLLRATFNDRFVHMMAWMMGVTLFIHCIQFIAVSYFGQVHFSWYMLLAALASLTGGWKHAEATSTEPALSAGAAGAAVARLPAALVPNRRRRLLGEPV